ncbi:hypothetical protein M427DRAFT_421831 [Gonapodya prolifera JEL478]|uniref:Uncharacterized protein n=1 Tax=Gonapodya prolifera (strain JEL478) TaxID=1344416 RepID=A0A139A4I5_GONPJ|nr:hypothetical protein M427DRAFT_421831 [Gonapodya prolifera JEL478]|eukprot:KXS11737.1 hypothetical protein M427DRAFT_421831 [Gonapodya prolifera JEL478]
MDRTSGNRRRPGPGSGKGAAELCAVPTCTTPGKHATSSGRACNARTWSLSRMSLLGLGPGPVSSNASRSGWSRSVAARTSTTSIPTKDTRLSVLDVVCEEAYAKPAKVPTIHVDGYSGGDLMSLWGENVPWKKAHLCGETVEPNLVEGGRVVLRAICIVGRREWWRRTGAWVRNLAKRTG